MSSSLLDLYSDYLISSFGQTSATGLSRLTDGVVSHDQVTRFLSEPRKTGADLWAKVKPLVRQIQSSEGVLIFDDTIEEKPYTDENEIVCWHWDHSQNRHVKGINFVTALYQNAGEIERRLLASDARRAQDDMFGYPIDRVLGEAFGDHAYGFPTTGFPDSVERITVAEVQEWARRLTRTKPVVVAVGDLGLGAMRRAMAPLLEWPSAIDGATHAPLPARATHAHEDRKKEQTALAMAFPAFPFESPERYTLSITASVLSGLAGRLFDELRERRSLAYTVGAFPWLGRYAGLMLSYIATSPEREDEARSAMLSELRRLVDDPPDEAELNRAKQYTAGSVEMRQQRGRSMADEVLHAWMKGAIETVPEQASRLRAVTQQQVVEVASRVFLGEQRAEFVVRGVPKDN